MTELTLGDGLLLPDFQSKSLSVTFYGFLRIGARGAPISLLINVQSDKPTVGIYYLLSDCCFLENVLEDTCAKCGAPFLWGGLPATGIGTMYKAGDGTPAESSEPMLVALGVPEYQAVVDATEFREAFLDRAAWVESLSEKVMYGIQIFDVVEWRGGPPSPRVGGEWFPKHKLADEDYRAVTERVKQGNLDFSGIGLPISLGEIAERVLRNTEAVDSDV